MPSKNQTASFLPKTLASKLFPDPQSALNKLIKIDNNPVIVTGVIDDVPHNSHFSFNAIRSFAADYKGDWGALEIYTYILLKKNTHIGQLQAKLPAFCEEVLCVQLGKMCRSCTGAAAFNRHSFTLTPEL